MIFNAENLQAEHDREACEIAAHAAAQLPQGDPHRCPSCGVRHGDNHAQCDDCYDYRAAEWSDDE